jgi:hypothetical protein
MISVHFTPQAHRLINLYLIKFMSDLAPIENTTNLSFFIYRYDYQRLVDLSYLYRRLLTLIFSSI